MILMCWPVRLSSPHQTSWYRRGVTDAIALSALSKDAVLALAAPDANIKRVLTYGSPTTWPDHHPLLCCACGTVYQLLRPVLTPRHKADTTGPDRSFMTRMGRSPVSVTNTEHKQLPTGLMVMCNAGNGPYIHERGSRHALTFGIAR